MSVTMDVSSFPVSLIVVQEGNIPIVGGKQGSLVELALFCEIRYLYQVVPALLIQASTGLRFVVRSSLMTRGGRGSLKMLRYNDL